MALRTVRTDEDPILRKKSREVTVFDDKLEVLIEDMIETMHDSNGIGIAAPQVGILKRAVIVMDPEEEEPDPIPMINPVILARDGEQCKEEGCLSVPGKTGTVNRPYSITVAYQDVTGEKYEANLEGDIVRVVCHEIDHLDGVLFTDKVVEDTTERNDEKRRKRR
ncbi:MAG: peptide deformylase [Bacillota bacterium]|nr:peptide deformylase [Bacillota bacterium]